MDFDVHHGDGTQDITYNKENVMYISMHRFDQGNFFPKGRNGGYEHLGEEAAAGFNVNIAFDHVVIWFSKCLVIILLCCRLNWRVLISSTVG